MWAYTCNQCSRTWACHYRCDSICPICLGTLRVDSDEGAETVGRAEWMDLQRAAWDAREALCQPPAQPLDQVYLSALLSPVGVQGELDPATGRFYVRALLLPDGGRLHLGVSSGSACIYQHEKPHA